MPAFGIRFRVGFDLNFGHIFASHQALRWTNRVTSRPQQTAIRSPRWQAQTFCR